MTTELDCAGAVKFALGSNIGRMRKLWGIEVSEEQARSEGVYSRSVLLTPTANPKKRGSVGCIRLSSVLGIARPSHIAKIFYSIIRLRPIDMINVTTRPNTVNIQPSKAVGLVSVASQREANVAVMVNKPKANRVFQRNSSAGSTDYCNPHKDASLGIVVKQFAQACCGKIGLSHDTVPSLIGQRPGRVISTSGLRHFNLCAGV